MLSRAAPYIRAANFADVKSRVGYGSAQMKTRSASIVCILAILAGGFSSLAAEQQTSRPSPAVKAADAVIVRPISFASAVVGGALFVVSLPVTAPLKKTKSTAEALVVKPVRNTFQRPLGDMDAMAD